MAHEIENVLLVGKPAWHGLGIQVQDAPGVDEAIKLAGLDWKVKTAPLFTADGRTVDSKATIRESDNTILGVVGPKYHPLQNTEAFEFFRPFISEGEAKIETAGSLRNGKRVWVLAKLNRAPIEVTKGDIVEKYLLVSNSHDGTMAVRVGFTPIRVVCANTLAMSHNSEQSQLIRIMHSKSVAQNLENIREIVNAANAQFEATAEQYRALVRKDVKQADIEKFVKIVFYSENESFEEQRKKIAYEKLTERIQQLFEHGRGNDLAGTRGTMWALYNGVTEYLSYEKSRDQNVRLDNLWFGSSKTLNEKALEVAVQLAA